jgi:hypothetical protein
LIKLFHQKIFENADISHYDEVAQSELKDIFLSTVTRAERAERHFSFHRYPRIINFPED